MLASLVLVSFGTLAAHSPAGPPPVVENVQQAPAQAQKPWPPDGVIRPRPGVVSPRVIKHQHPSYTPEAMRAGIEGEVFMEAVVLADGAVGEVRVTRRLAPGLDEQAERALRLWQFEPGRRDGVAVPVLVEVQMSFALRDNKPERVAALEPSAEAWPPAGVLRPGRRVETPRLVHEVKPSYTGAAMRAGIQGTVWMEAVVGTDGRVAEARVVKSLDSEHGLDEEALRTIRQWRFAPGRRDGVAVPVVVEVQMTFVMRK